MNELSEIDIACSTDDNYAEYCAVMLCSVLENNTDAKVTVHVLVDSLSESNKSILCSIVQRYGQRVVFYTVDSGKLKNVKYRKNNPLSSAAYYRIILGSALPESVDKVLYLDCDLLVLGSLRSIWKLELKDYALAAVKDQECLPVNEEHRLQLNFSYRQPYFCSGVMLINLKYWRENGVEEKLIEFACRDRFVYFHDQDALNFLFAGKWIELSPKWNRFNLVAFDKKNFETFDDEREYLYNPKVLHYASPAKPWFNICFVNMRAEFEKYYKICFGRKLKRIKYRKNKLLIYKRIFEVNVLNLIYRCPVFFGVIILFVLNTMKFIVTMLMGKNALKMKCFTIKNVR